MLMIPNDGYHTTSSQCTHCGNVYIYLLSQCEHDALITLMILFVVVGFAFGGKKGKVVCVGGAREGEGVRRVGAALE